METEQEEPKKACSRCNEEKPISAFNSDRSKPDGHESRCRECRSSAKKISTSERGKSTNTLMEKRMAALTPNQATIVKAKTEAMRVLVNNHYREFQLETSRALSRLGAERKWQAVS
jgi:hypothetical protein